MTLRFLIDEDVDAAVVKGLRLRAPGADILDVKMQGLRRTKDEVLLELAYTQGRVLVSNDRSTMTRHFRERLTEGFDSCGVLILDAKASIGELVDALLLVWSASTAEECFNVLQYLPFR